MSRKTLLSKLSLVIVSVALVLSISSFVRVFQNASAGSAAGNKVDVWLTAADLQRHLAQQDGVSFSTGSGSGVIRITVDENKAYQQMDGFGASLTDGSAWLISNKMSKGQRDDLMVNLFDPVRGIGLNFLRQPMGASDLTLPASGEYSYDDMPKGETDSNLTHFSIAHDEAYII